MRPLNRVLAATMSILVIGALLGSATAGARPVGLIKEYPMGANVFDLTIGPDGNAWFTLSPSPGTRPRGRAAIGRITPQGKVTRFRVGLIPGSEPGTIVAGPGGTLWFADDGRTPAIGRITPGGAIAEFNAGISTNGVPWKLAIGSDGNVWFTHTGLVAPSNQTIGRITPQGTITEFSAGLNPKANLGEIVAGHDGNLWFADESASPPIGRITTTGQITEFGGVASDEFSFLRGPAAGPDGNLWFSENPYRSPPSVERISPSGAITRFSAGLSPRDEMLGPFVSGPDSDVWFGAVGSGRNRHGGRGSSSSTAIGRITPGGAIAEFSECIPPTSSQGPTAIAAGPDGNVWFAIESAGTSAHPTNALTPGVGRITPSGRITMLRDGLHYFSSLDSLVGGAGAVWFIDRPAESIGRIVPGKAPANTFLLLAPRTVGPGAATAFPVIVPGPGTLTLELPANVPRSDRQTVVAKAPACGRAVLHVKPKGIAEEKLNRFGAVALMTRITFKPTGGSPYSRLHPIVLRKRGRR